MLRYHICAVTQILLKPRALCSTAVNPEQNVPQSLIQRLSQEFEDVGAIARILKNLDVKNINFDDWKSRICVMKKYCFTEKECFKMISKYPHILKIPVARFDDTLDGWFNACLGFENFQSILLKNPELLEVHAKDIEERLPQFIHYFGPSKKLVKLLTNSPNVMRDNWPSVVSKTEYLLKEKRFGSHEVLEAHAMSKSMHYIQFRLDLLEKCGIFKPETRPVHKINKYDRTRHKNPELKKILLTTVQQFVNIAKISVEEYAVCKDLFMSNEDDYDELEVPNTYGCYEKTQK